MFFLGDEHPRSTDGESDSGQLGEASSAAGAEIADSVLIMNATLWASRREPPRAISPLLGDAERSQGRRVVGHGIHPRHHVDGDRRRRRDVRGRVVVGTRNGRPVAGDRAGLANDGTQAWTLPRDSHGQRVVRVTARDAAPPTPVLPRARLFEVHDQTLGVDAWWSRPARARATATQPVATGRKPRVHPAGRRYRAAGGRGRCGPPRGRRTESLCRRSPRVEAGTDARSAGRETGRRAPPRTARFVLRGAHTHHAQLARLR